MRSLKQPLYSYQREGVDRFLEAKRLLLADDMGLGKTAQAIASCHTLWTCGKARRGIILVPASLKPQWLREWQLFTDAPVAVVDGAPEARKAILASTKAGFLIMNYEQLLRDLEAVIEWQPDIVVLDEAQRMKNWATKTAVYVKKLAPAYRLVLTGTPMENRLDELASILDWVDDFALEPKWRLLPWHTTTTDGKREVSGARNLDTLRQRLKPGLVRRLRQEVLRQLPSRTDARVPIELTEAQRDEHDALRKPILSILNQAAHRPLTQAEFLRLMQLLTAQRIIANGLAQFSFEEVWPGLSRMETANEAVLKNLSTPKLVELREIISQLAVSQKRKVVVFSQWRRMLCLAEWASRDVLAGSGLRAAFFTGQESPKRRTQNIVDFHDDPRTSVLFATDAGGVGLNLQRAANAVVNIDMPWNPAVLEQRIGRIYRLGQKDPINVYNLVTEDSIEARIFQLVGTKQAFFKGLFDGGSDEVRFENAGSFLSRIEKIVEAPVAPEGARPAENGTEETASDEPMLELAEGSVADALPPPTATPATVGTEESTPRAPVSGPPEVRGASNAPAATARAAPAAGAAGAEDVARLFSALKVRATEKGGMIIEAPPEAARTLAALFEGMARLLKAAPGHETPEQLGGRGQ